MNVAVPTMSELRERAARRIPGGVNSNVRLDAPNTFFARGEGPRIYDVEGRDYIDYLLGQGPAFLGHAHPAVVCAVQQAIATGMVYAAQNTLEVEAAELVCEALGWADMVRFNMTGTEAVQARAAPRARRHRPAPHPPLRGPVSRLARQRADQVRAGTRRRPRAPASCPKRLEATIVMPWNDLDALRRRSASTATTSPP